jgi:hypothetical protein
MVNFGAQGFISGRIILKNSQNEERRAFDRTPKRGFNALKNNTYLVPLNGI